MPVTKRRSVEPCDKSRPLLSSTALRKTQSSGFLEKFRRTKPTVSSGLECFEEAAKLICRAATLQRQGAVRLAEWATQGGNTAMEDVTKKLAELYVLHETEQRNLLHTIAGCVQKLQRVDDSLEMDEQQKEAERRLADVTEREKKLQAEMKKDPGSNSDQIRKNLRQMLTTAEEKERIERTLDSYRAENEVVKMLRFRTGMKRLAEAYVDNLSRTQDIFLCQREISELVPALATEDVRNVRYEGAYVSREKVDRVRRSLDRASMPPANQLNELESPRSQLLGTPQRRRRSEPPTRHLYSRHREFASPSNNEAIVPETPPPPYRR
ncbi:unnamed protein product [Caenorhabditis auriculariae]|uniref:Uncharacterized protein n=1 Tax=Caenorhabditis auriculariae TaxID=2777116 RepID=A0A8S1HKA8_9PELO|nr:unnamed protein product [Caenorhabditis auriculariae]